MRYLVLFLFAVVSCIPNLKKETASKKQYELQLPNIRIERYPVTFNQKGEGPVQLPCGNSCTEAELSGYSQSQISNFPKEGDWKEYIEKIRTDNSKYSVLGRTGVYQNNLREGMWKSYYETGEVLRETPYSKGQKNGTEYKYTVSGAQVEMIAYSMGKKEGPFWKKDDHGNLEEEGRYSKNQKTGEWKEYYTDSGSSKLKSVTHYVNDKKEGHEIRYQKDGSTLMAEGNYANGKQTGPWKFYHKDGNLASEGQFGLRNIQGEMKAVQIGPWKEFYSNGNVFAEGIRDRSRKGVWKFYHNNGALAFKGQMQNEFMMSSGEAYDRKGQLSGKGAFQFSILTIDEDTGDIKSDYKPGVPFTFYKDGHKTMEIIDEETAKEYDPNGQVIGSGPIVPGVNKKNGCWNTNKGKIYYVFGNPNPTMGKALNCP